MIFSAQPSPAATFINFQKLIFKLVCEMPTLDKVQKRIEFQKSWPSVTFSHGESVGVRGKEALFFTPAQTLLDFERQMGVCSYSK